MEEQIIFEGRPAWINYLFSLIIGIMSSAVIIGIFIILWVLYDIFSNQYKISTQRIIQRRGLIAKKTSEIEVGDIRNIVVKQGVIQRIFNAGDLLIGTAATAGEEVRLKGLKNPEKIRDLIRKQRKLGEKAI